MSGKLIKCRIIRHHCEFLFVDTTKLTLTQHISLHCHLFSPQFKTSVTLQKRIDLISARALLNSKVVKFELLEWSKKVYDIVSHTVKSRL